ncbi:unnamed protein product [Chrysoparadoxa australica]
MPSLTHFIIANTTLCFFLFRGEEVSTMGSTVDGSTSPTSVAAPAAGPCFGCGGSMARRTDTWMGQAVEDTVRRANAAITVSRVRSPILEDICDKGIGKPDSQGIGLRIDRGEVPGPDIAKQMPRGGEEAVQGQGQDAEEAEVALNPANPAAHMGPVELDIGPAAFALRPTPVHYSWPRASEDKPAFLRCSPGQETGSGVGPGLYEGSDSAYAACYRTVPVGMSLDRAEDKKKTPLEHCAPHHFGPWTDVKDGWGRGTEFKLAGRDGVFERWLKPTPFHYSVDILPDKGAKQSLASRVQQSRNIYARSFTRVRAPAINTNSNLGPGCYKEQGFKSVSEVKEVNRPSAAFVRRCSSFDMRRLGSDYGTLYPRHAKPREHLHTSEHQAHITVERYGMATKQSTSNPAGVVFLSRQ